MKYIILAILAMLLLGACTGTGCSKDAMMCPDGSSVGRSGPSCDFEQCPNVTPCEDPRPEVCTQQYDPVCGSNIKTYSNGCMACTDQQVQYWAWGECR